MSSKTVLVTGANRGIGYSIVQALATHFPSYTYILTARSYDNATVAIMQLREIGVQAKIEPLALDITNDMSIAAAVKAVKESFGSLNILVNNAGIARYPSNDPTKNRESYAVTFDTNVTSVAHVTMAFLPLLKTSTPAPPLVINVSSARGSLARSATGQLPATAAVSYSISKAALNSLTLEFMKGTPDVKFYAANPGHCRTAFNEYEGKRDPLEGANVVVGIVEGAGSVEPGFWETQGAMMALTRVPW